MIDKQKILEILNKESVSENSSNNNRVIIEQDFEIIAEEIVKLFAIPVVSDMFSAQKVKDAYGDGLDYGMGNGGLKFHLENYR